MSSSKSRVSYHSTQRYSKQSHVDQRSISKKSDFNIINNDDSKSSSNEFNNMDEHDPNDS